MGIRSSLSEIGQDRALEYAEDYFSPAKGFTGSRKYTGSHFESLGALQNHRDEFTAVDLLAVQSLSVKVSARAAIEILQEQSGDITALLKGIPHDVALGSLTPDAFELHMGEASYAQQLWDLLRRNGRDLERWGIGPTTASKMIARKRPHLIPIQDSVVDKVIERGEQSSWRLWWEALTEDDALEHLADEVREHVGHPGLSTLRVLDIVLWMHGKPTEKKQR